MKYFSIEELTHSETAERKRIRNEATPEAEENLKALVGAVLDPLRERWGKRIEVTSGYRSAALNKAVGGAAGSQHTKGEAADIAAGSPKETAELGRMIFESGCFDQLIFERSNRSCTECVWIHVSWKRTGENRRQALRNQAGSKRYEPINRLT